MKAVAVYPGKPNRWDEKADPQRSTLREGLQTIDGLF